MYRVRPTRGFGAYPGDCYFDKNRPSWLPYFIDTPTESQAKLACSGVFGVIPVPTGGVTAQEILNPSSAYPAPPALTAPPPGPSTVEQETVPGAWTPDMAINQMVRNQQAQNQAFFNQLAQSLGVSGNGGGLSKTALIALGVVAGGALLLLSGGSRRRY